MTSVSAFYTYMHLFILILEVTPSEQKLGFSRSGETPSVYHFRTLFNLPLQDCRKECMARPSCASINYFRSSQKCELNKIAVGEWSVKDMTGSVYSEKTDLTDVSLENNND